MIDTNELRRLLEEGGKNNIDLSEIHELLDRLEAAESETASWKGLATQFSQEADALRAKIEAMERQEPVAWRWELKTGQYTYVDKPEHAGKNARVVPLYALPGLQGEEK